MNTGPVDEQISAWLDDELPAAELELLATRLSADPGRQAKAARYALIGTLVRGDGPAGLSAMHLASRVATATAGESGATGRPPRELPPGRFLRPAMAAALALAAVGLFQVLRPGAPSPGPGALPVSGPPVAIATSPALHSPERLTNYLVSHGEFAGRLPTKVVDSHIVNQRPYMIKVRAVERLAHD